MKTHFTIYHLGASLIFASLFFIPSIINAQDARIAGYLNKFKNHEYKEKLDSIVNFYTSSGNKENKREFLVNYNDSILTVVSTYYTWNIMQNKWDAQSKTIFKYDNLDRLIHHERYKFENSSWRGGNKIIYEYYQNTNLESSDQVSVWNTETNNFDLKSKTEYTYNENHKPLVVKGYNWSKDKQEWLYYATQENFYNKNGKLDSMISGNENIFYRKEYYIYDKNDNNILLTIYTDVDSPTKEETQYDSQNRKINYIKSHQSNNLWVSYIKGDIEYEGELDNIEITQEWDSTKHEWVYLDRIKQYFDTKENPINFEREKYNRTEAVWQPLQKLIFAYNDKKQITQRSLYYEWNSQFNYLKAQSQEIYDYDAFGNLLSRIYYVGKDGSNQFVEISKFESIYDFAQDTSSIFIPSIIDFNDFLTLISYSQILSENRYNYEPNEWHIVTKKECYYSPVIYTGVETPTSNSKSIIYPNPASNEITIASYDNIIGIEIYDVLGNLKLSHNNYLSQIDNKLDIQGMASGVYVVKIITINGSRNELLTIQR